MDLWFISDAANQDKHYSTISPDNLTFLHVDVSLASNKSLSLSLILSVTYTQLSQV